MVSFSKVMDAIVKFAEEEIFPGMTEVQEIAARVAVSWAFDSADAALNLLADNKVARAFGFIDSNKNIDAARALGYLRTQLQRKKKIQITVPILGKFSFVPEDVDKILKYIEEGK